MSVVHNIFLIHAYLMTWERRRKRETDRQTDRQTNKQRQRETETERVRDRQREGHVTMYTVMRCLRIIGVNDSVA